MLKLGDREIDSPNLAPKNEVISGEIFVRVKKSNKTNN